MIHICCQPQQNLLLGSTHVTSFGRTDHPQALNTLYLTLKIKCMHVDLTCSYIRFILRVKYHVFNSKEYSVLPKHVASVDMRWRSCMWHCAKSPKVAGSITEGASWIFHRHKLSLREHYCFG